MTTVHQRRLGCVHRRTPQHLLGFSLLKAIASYCKIPTNRPWPEMIHSGKGPKPKEYFIEGLLIYLSSLNYIFQYIHEECSQVVVSWPLQNGPSSLPYFVEWLLLRKVVSEGHPREGTFWTRVVVCLCCCDWLLWQQLMRGQFFILGCLPGPSKIYLACMWPSWWFLRHSADIGCHGQIAWFVSLLFVWHGLVLGSLPCW